MLCLGSLQSDMEDLCHQVAEMKVEEEEDEHSDSTKEYASSQQSFLA